MLGTNKMLAMAQPAALSVIIFSDGENYSKPSAVASYSHFIEGTEEVVYETLAREFGASALQGKQHWSRLLFLGESELRSHPTHYAAMSAGYSSSGYTLLHCTLDTLESADARLAAAAYTIIHTRVPGIAVILSTDSGFTRTKALFSSSGWIVAAVYQQESVPSVHGYRASGGVGLIQISFHSQVLPVVRATQAALVAAVVVVPGARCAALTRRGRPCGNTTLEGIAFCQGHKDSKNINPSRSVFSLSPTSTIKATPVFTVGPAMAAIPPQADAEGKLVCNVGSCTKVYKSMPAWRQHCNAKHYPL
ncbi:hypothetical protein BCR33DRAFT_251170 [Rhizoclosmatium globosum]|uniref:Uncharacterized protein n=1 Tax=Rhizoclosmatium globosum TaxID=329046 RepID=A0A1Y2C9Z1_9FUNG|nr:hypothetical protein BCR33DRAFT_251170 [Rhizoclosmatium globosum]|eukprot:ORY43850.1 hypothetical protein BCR33DRAFT_251170 [Rhizoclosmatium globosum]